MCRQPPLMRSSRASPQGWVPEELRESDALGRPVPVTISLADNREEDSAGAEASAVDERRTNSLADKHSPTHTHAHVARRVNSLAG